MDQYNRYPQNSSYDYRGPEVYETMEHYVAKTFLWMLAGLGVTFLTAMGVYLVLPGHILLRLSGMHLVLAIAELVVVWNLARHLGDMSTQTATGMFFLYAVLNGLTFSVLLFAYSVSSLIFAFLAAGVYFGVMAAYGYFTHRDMTSWSRMIGGGLIAMLIVNVLGMFFGFGRYEIVISCVGIVLFLCITAYDTQRIKGFYYNFAHDPEMAHKAAIYGALELYLDFINLFLYLLRMIARHNND